MRMSQQAKRQDGRVHIEPGGETRGDDQRGNGAWRKSHDRENSRPFLCICLGEIAGVDFTASRTS